MIERVEPLKMGASLPVRLIRAAYEAQLAKNKCNTKNSTKGQRARALAKYTKLAEEAALTEAALCFGAADGDISKISPTWQERFLGLARGEASLVGWSHTGFTYHDEPDAEYIPSRDDHGTPGVVKVWRVPTTAEIVDRLVDKWIAITGVGAEGEVVAAFTAIAQNDAEAWQRAEEIAAQLAVNRGIGVEDVETPLVTEGITQANADAIASDIVDGLLAKNEVKL